MSASSLRRLAEKLDISRATVSAALNGKPGVKAATRAKVLAAAEELGYRFNPLASALMGELRRSRGGVFRGVLTVIHPEAGRDGAARELDREMEKGAQERAEALGFKLDALRLNRAEREPARLNEIVAARGIRGVLFMPGASAGLIERLDWTALTGVQIGEGAAGDGLNVVAPDHHATVAGALEEVRRLGFSRPGLVLDADLPGSVLRRWEAAYYACRLAETQHDCPRPLVAGAGDELFFHAWFAAGGFDVVLASDARVAAWLRKAGARVPEAHGFCGLNVIDARGGVAGMNLQGRAIGARAVELLSGQVLRNEIGRPTLPVTILVPPCWVPGATLSERGQTAQTEPQPERLSA